MSECYQICSYENRPFLDLFIFLTFNILCPLKKFCNNMSMRSPKAGVYSVVSLDEFEDLVIKDLKAMLSTRVWEDERLFILTLTKYVDV